MLAARFGLGIRTDAFFIAIGVPQLVWSILASSGTRVLTPIFTQLLDEEGSHGIWRSFSLLGNLSLIVMPLISAAGVLLSPLVVAIAGAGLQGEAAALTITLNRILFLMLIPAGLIQLMKAVLNAHRHFSTPAATTLLQYVIIIVTILVLEGTLGVLAVAVGYVLSMIGQVLILGAVILTKGGKYVATLDVKDPIVRKTARLLTPPLSGEVLGQSIAVIERALASFLPPGSVSALAFAGRILRALDITFLNNVVVAILPRLSSLATVKDFSGLKRLASMGLRVAWAITIPLTALVVALNLPIVRLLFQRGAFDQQAAVITGRILSLYIIGFPFLATVRMLVAVFYAKQDTRTPFFIRAAMLGFNLAGDLILMRLLGVFGLALATSLTYVVNAFLVGRLLRRSIGPLNLRVNLYLAKTAIAAFAMALTTVALRVLLEQILDTNTFSGLLLQLIPLLAVAGTTYLGALALLRIEEYQQVVGWIRGRLPLRVT